MRQVQRRPWALLFALGALFAVQAAWGMAAERTELPNGLRVLAVEDRASDIAGVQLLVGASAATEPETVAGLRAVLQQMIHTGLRERLRSEPDLQLLRDEDNAAGMGAAQTAFTVGTSWEYAQFAGQATSEALPAMLRFLREGAFAPALTDEAFSTAVGITRLGLDGEQAAAPAEATSYLFRQAADGVANPRARSVRGTHATLSHLDLAQLQAYHRRYYVPNLCCLCVVAPLPAGEITALAQEAFGELPRGREVEAVAPTLPTQSAIRVAEDPGLQWNPALPPGFQMASLIAGCPAPAYGDAEYATAAVVASLLAGTTDKPGLALEDDGLYRALGLEPLGVTADRAREQGAVEPLPLDYGPTNHIAFHAYVVARSIEGFSERLLEHFAQLAAGEPPVTEAQLAQAKAVVLNRHAQELEPRSLQALELARAELLGGGWAYAAHFDDQVRAVTVQDVARVAAAYFGRHAVAVRLPAQQAEEQPAEPTSPPGTTAKGY